MPAVKDAMAELPDMPKRPELRAKGGRVVEHATITVRGGESFDRHLVFAVDHIEGAPNDEAQDALAEQDGES